MTCVLTSAWQHFDTDSPWYPMNPDITATTSDLERQPSHGYASSESESKRPSGGSGKKRASRAGTRSVTTLSAAQLERKRANDREAQRAIRQRTKDHIESLEKTVSELRGSQESNEKIMAVTAQRNRKLEEEIAFLRSKLIEGSYLADVSPTEDHRLPESGMISVHSTSPATQASASGSSVQRPSSASTPRSLSVTTASSSSRHGSFQQQSGFLSNAPSSAVSISDQGAIVGTVPLTTWRSHDVTSSVHPVQYATPQAPETIHTQHPPTYHAVNTPGRPEWAAPTQTYQYSVNPEPQRPRQFETQQHPPPSLPATQQQQYVQTTVQPYTPAPPPSPVPQQQSYHPPQIPPQTEFQNTAVGSPAYQVQQQHAYQHAPQQQTYQPPQQPQAYQQPPPMQMTPMQGGLPSVAEYSAPHGQMHPPPIPTTQYHAPPTEQHYAPQAVHPPMQYRDEATGRSYTLTHYPSG